MPRAPKWVFAIVSVILLLAAARFLNVSQHLRLLLNWIGQLGVWGPVALILAYVLACILLIPGSLLTLGAGLLFGIVRGFVYVWVGAVAGATAAFLVGRFLARGIVTAKFQTRPNFKAIDESVAKEGWKIVLLMRLSPIFPFNMLNYAFGITRVSLRDYFFASAIGMIPGTMMYVYIGSLAGDLTKLGNQNRSRTTAEWVLYGIGFLSTVAVTWHVTRLAKRALAGKTARTEDQRQNLAR